MRLDQFHVGGLAATMESSKDAGITETTNSQNRSGFSMWRFPLNFDIEE
ncbi:MAG TPA: hypothetical protein VEQ67_07255 [Mycobacterium sp.]|nr:hypothetical protein [Mycobacterium sp.]